MAEEPDYMFWLGTSATKWFSADTPFAFPAAIMMNIVAALHGGTITSFIYTNIFALTHAICRTPLALS
jgi:CBS-domain-containing membrane protein